MSTQGCHPGIGQPARTTRAYHCEAAWFGIHVGIVACKFIRRDYSAAASDADHLGAWHNADSGVGFVLLSVDNSGKAYRG
jgi:hypothetical protein